MKSGEDWSQLLLNVATQSCRLSFKKLFQHFYPVLVGQALKSGVSREVAAELAQETMMKVWRQAASFNLDKGTVALWIFVIARNVKFDYFRKLKNDPLNYEASDLYDSLDNSLSYELGLDEKIDIQLIKEQIVKLPAEQQAVIQKIYFEGMTQQEVAEQDGIPLGTIKSRVRLAIAHVKLGLEGKEK